MRTQTTERRIDQKIRFMRWAAVLCALFAAAGIASGMHEANPAGGWLVPAFAGIVAATAFAAWWHVSISAIVGMVKTITIVALIIGSALVTAVALGASAQAIATAVSGRAALAAELSDRVDQFNTAAAEAYRQATSWRSVAESANVLGAGYDKQAEMERSGGHGTGKGEGPKWSSLREAAESFRTGAAAMYQLLNDAKEEQSRANLQLGLLRDAAAHGDQQAFMAAVGEIGTIISRLNAIDPKPIVESTGMIHVTTNGINLSADTAEWEAKAAKALADRKQVDVPSFTPLSPGEATRRQAFGSAMHGWILAGAIDVLPLFFLGLAFVLSREVWLNEPVVREKLTPEGVTETEKSAVKRLLNRDDDNVVRLTAAE